MNPFWQSDTYAIIKAMKANGNRPGLIQQWKDAVEDWAVRPEYANLPDAKAVRAWLPMWQVRPFYTAAELVPLWPALAIAVGWDDKMPPTRSAKRLEHELDYGGLPRVTGTQWMETVSVMRNYFIVERIHDWAGRELTMEEFQNALG